MQPIYPATLLHRANHFHYTGTPPFYVIDSGWRDAVTLRAGEQLVLRSGEEATIEQVQYEILETPVTVYNFEVEDYHTYYVTDSSILTHNMCAKSNKRGDNTPGIKKQGREKKEKKKGQGNWVSKKWGHEKKAKKHTPGRDHRKKSRR